MPIASQAQARYELAHAEDFGGKEHVLKKIRAAGGLRNLPFRKGGERRNRNRINAMTRRKIANKVRKKLRREIYEE